MHTLNGLIDKYNSPVGVDGRVVLSSDYKGGSFSQNYEMWKEQKVDGDFLCNTYGGVMESMKVFWRYSPYTQRNGEDIHYSLSNNLECTNHIHILPRTVLTDNFENHGHDAVATYLGGGHYEIRGQIIRSWIVRGASLIESRKAISSYPARKRAFSSYYSKEAIY